MPKFRDRVCTECGDVQKNTATHSAVCLSCFKAKKTAEKIAEEQTRLAAIYGDVVGPSHNKHNQRCYTFTHVCGTTQTWTFSNLLKQLKSRPDHVPCSSCGGKERMAAAFDGYLKKFGRDWNDIDFDDWRAYVRSVRKISEVSYKQNIHTINPLRLKRGVKTWHLDHKVAIIECYLRGVPPEIAGAADNLQILKANENLSKGRF